MLRRRSPELSFVPTIAADAPPRQTSCVMRLHFRLTDCFDHYPTSDLCNSRWARCGLPILILITGLGKRAKHESSRSQSEHPAQQTCLGQSSPKLASYIRLSTSKGAPIAQIGFKSPAMVRVWDHMAECLPSLSTTWRYRLDLRATMKFLSDTVPRGASYQILEVACSIGLTKSRANSFRCFNR